MLKLLVKLLVVSFNFQGCEEIEEQTLPNDLRPGLRAHWTANAGIEVDANHNILSWESLPNENGDVFVN